MWAWLLNPGMLLAGGAAASIPIIIHLLNKRRYRIVQWAAMDFLLEDDKKNRRRVRIENLILLALRCLAMFLLGMMLARPLMPSSVQLVFGQKALIERVVVIDDSLSQWVLRDGQPALDDLKTGFKDWLAELARSEVSDDWLTVYVTSRPEQPILSYEPVTANTLVLL
ncbi:MAG TPA: BatA domain-containing protein, partial [Pirellulaceae bacterium]|nr:BatA domain-containing protein [Pirellulaceae bacterium]